ncbi:MAG: septum formation family protein [Actinomycetota bacterium]
MRRTGALAGLIVILAACGGDGGAGSTTTTVTTTATTTTTAPTTTTTTIAAGAGTWFEGLHAGDCFDDTATGGGMDFSVPVDVVPCPSPHDNEAVAFVTLTPGADGGYPGDDAVGPESLELCGDEYQAFLNHSIDESGLFGFQIFPDATDWENGVDWAVCGLYGSEPLVGTAASGGLTAPGETLAVLAETNGVADIWLVDGSTGELVTNLTGPAGTEVLSQPSWAPDGSGIAYAATGPGGDGDIYLVSTDGLGVAPLLEAAGQDDRPVLGPVGTKLAFISDRDAEEFEIYSIDFDGDGTVTRITDFADRDSSPSWSPDGTELAFRRRVDGNSDVYVMNADGSNVRRLTTDPGFDGDPAWSPDGSEILFSSDRSGNFDIWVMNADGSGQVPLTDHPADDEYPAWSRDGELIAFQSTRQGGTSVWIMRWDGSEQSNLTWRAPTGYPAFAPVDMS